MWLRSSTQPISTTRSPLACSVPVVSVSRTISRNMVQDLSHSLPPRIPRPDRPARHLKIPRTWALAEGKPRPVSTRKWARRRFSASGICLSRMSRNCSSVMPGRDRTRSRWISGGRRDHQHRVAAASPRRSRRAAGRRGPPGIRRPADSLAGTGSSSARTRGWTIASSLRRASGRPRTREPRIVRSTAPLATAPGKASAINGTAAPR